MLQRTSISKQCPKCLKFFEVERKLNEDGTQRINKEEKTFCSYACSNFRQIKKEFKIISCKDCGKLIEVHKHSTPSKTRCETCRKAHDYIQSRTLTEYTCFICHKKYKGVIGKSDKSKRVCSKECQRRFNSINRSLKLREQGTSNLNTKQSIYTYKHIQNINCDSILEQVAIRYLVDIFIADIIENFKTLLQFYNKEGKRIIFRPDFYVKKDNIIYIVEVKMKWSDNSPHDYNKYITEKKGTLKNYCEKKNFNMIWLDFEYDKTFYRMYEKELSDRKKQSATYINLQAN